MVGSYIPPHLRNRTDGDSKPRTPPPSSSNLTALDISNYFWPAQNADTDDGTQTRASDPSGKTMHDSAGTPGRLAYVLLFPGANPKWETEKIIFTKTRLDLLPSRLAGSLEATLANGTGATGTVAVGETQPAPTNEDEAERDAIAVFKQIPGKSYTPGFTFEGWYKIERLSFLEPRSDELIRMLEQKWTLTDRRGNEYLGTREAQNWKQSLVRRWAVVKFVKDHKAEEERGEPVIERWQPQEKNGNRSKKPKKSVNELLAEMRVKDTAPETGGDG